MEDHHHAVLELGGQVEGELGPRQPPLGRRHLLQHVVHDVIAAREWAALGEGEGPRCHSDGRQGGGEVLTR